MSDLEDRTLYALNVYRIACLKDRFPLGPYIGGNGPMLTNLACTPGNATSDENCEKSP
jgi:hypothetical protein